MKKTTNKRRRTLRKNQIIVSLVSIITMIAFILLAGIEESVKTFGMSLTTACIYGGVLLLVLVICGVFFSVNSDIIERMSGI